MSAFCRRQYLRYYLKEPLIGYIEHNFQRHVGHVVNLSLGGFLIVVPGLRKSEIRIGWNMDSHLGDFGEIVIPGTDKRIGGFGDLRHYFATNGGYALGFNWDYSDNLSLGADLNKVISICLAEKVAGYVIHGPTTISVRGHLSKDIRGDVLSEQNLYGKRVSLEGVVSADPSGIDVVLSLEKMGAVVDANEVFALALPG